MDGNWKQTLAQSIRLMEEIIVPNLSHESPELFHRCLGYFSNFDRCFAYSKRFNGEANHIC